MYCTTGVLCIKAHKKRRRRRSNFHLKDSDYKISNFKLSSDSELFEDILHQRKTENWNESQRDAVKPSYPTTTTATTTTILFVHLGGMDSNTKLKLYRNECTGCLK